MYYPRSYKYPLPIVSISEAKLLKDVVCVKGLILNKVNRKIVKGIMTTVKIKDNTGILEVNFINSSYIYNMYNIGDVVYVEGLISKNVMFHPKISKYKTDEIIPIYRLTNNLKNTDIIKSINYISDNLTNIIENTGLRDKFFINKNLFLDLINMHNPKTLDELNKSKENIIFMEFFVYLLELNKNELKKEKVEINILDLAYRKYDEIIKKLPFILTNSQEKVLDDIKNKINNKDKLNLLIQGDVGSGKTVVALLIASLYVYSGYQVVFMLPTEVLAKQQYDYFVSNFEDIDIVLLTGSTKKSEKEDIYYKIKTGFSKLIIGTHSVYNDDIVYNNLGLVIIDEQHRFGVLQRYKLSKQSKNLIIMSATPIPRTLALVMYGSIDILKIDVKPNNRKEIKNFVAYEDNIMLFYKSIEKRILENKEQAFIICPLVEKSENLQMCDVESYVEMLKTILNSKIKIDSIYGSMTPKEKDEKMFSMKQGNIDILVATTVIEVGINIPNATMILIENSERFGLSTLHQLRGRVGRGDKESFCIFVNRGDKNNERIKVISKSNDGFYIAEKDLEIRGAGKLASVEQSGEMGFRLANIYEHSDILLKANDIVSKLDKKQINEIICNNKEFIEKFILI